MTPKTTGSMRVALYLRVSTDSQAETGASLSMQEERLRAYCTARGWEAVEMYRDEGLSARTMERPELQRLLRDAKARKFGAVCVYSLSPLTRSVKDLGASDEQMLRFIEEAKPSRFPVFWPLMVTTGLRLGEGLAVRICDCGNLDRDLLQIKQSVYWPKGGGYRFGPPKSKASERSIKLDSQIAAMLRDHIGNERRRRGTIDPSALVFAREDGRPFVPKAVRADFCRLLKRAGIPSAVRIHDLRHTFLSFLGRQGVPMQVLGAIAGHASLASTAPYIHDDGRQDVAVAAVSRLVARRT